MEYLSIEQLYSYYLQANQQVCTDTRKLTKGGIFFALKGDKFNANTFAAKAIEEGCAFAIVDQEHTPMRNNFISKRCFKSIATISKSSS